MEFWNKGKLMECPKPQELKKPFKLKTLVKGKGKSFPKKVPNLMEMVLMGRRGNKNLNPF